MEEVAPWSSSTAFLGSLRRLRGATEGSPTARIVEHRLSCAPADCIQFTAVKGDIPVMQGFMQPIKPTGRISLLRTQNNSLIKSAY
jgi:hypothetical protein